MTATVFARRFFMGREKTFRTCMVIAGWICPSRIISIVFFPMRIISIAGAVVKN